MDKHVNSLDKTKNLRYRVHILNDSVQGVEKEQQMTETEKTPRELVHDAIEEAIIAARLRPMNCVAGELRGRTVQLAWEIHAFEIGHPPSYGEMYTEVEMISATFTGSEHPLVRIRLKSPDKRFKELYWYWEDEKKGTGHWILPRVALGGYEISVVLLQR